MNMSNTFVNRVAEAMIHEQTTTGKDGQPRTFYNVSVRNPESKTGYSSFSLNKGQVLPCTKKDGTVVDGMRNLFLGDAEKTRKVSVCTRKAAAKRAATYTNVEMTNAQIAELFAADYAAYKAAKATETAPETAAE